MALEVNMYSNEEPLPISLDSDNAAGILNAIHEQYFVLRQNRSSQKIEKVMAMTKPGKTDFFGKSKSVDLMKLSEDELKNISLEPKIYVILKEKMPESYLPQGGWKSRKSRKNRKSRKRR